MGNFLPSSPCLCPSLRMWEKWFVPTRPQWLNKTETSVFRKTVFLVDIFGWIFVSLFYPLIGNPSVEITWSRLRNLLKSMCLLWAHEISLIYNQRAIKCKKQYFLCFKKYIYFCGKFLMCFHANNLWLKFSYFSVWQFGVEMKTRSPLRKTMEKNDRNRDFHAGARLTSLFPPWIGKGVEWGNL